MKKLFAVLMTLVILLVGTGCAPAAGTVKGKIHFDGNYSDARVYLCEVNDYSPDTSVDPADVDWSDVVSEGWSSDEGFEWEGKIYASGFTCEIDSDFKYELGGQIAAGDEKSFTFHNVSAGEYAIVVFLNTDNPQLVYDENSVPIVFDLAAEKGIDIGLLTLRIE